MELQRGRRGQTECRRSTRLCKKPKGSLLCCGCFHPDSEKGEKMSAVLSPCPSWQDGSVDADLKTRQRYPVGKRNKGTKCGTTSACGIDHRQEGNICQTTPDKAKTKSVKIPWDFSIIVVHGVHPRAPDMVVIKREVGECFGVDFSVLFHETLPPQIKGRIVKYDPLWQGLKKAWDVRGAAPGTGMERWRHCISTMCPDVVVITPQISLMAAMAAAWPHTSARGHSSAGVTAWAGAMACAAGERCHPGRQG